MKQNDTQSSDFGSAKESAPPGFLRQMLDHLRISIVATVVLAILCCGIYPVVVWGLAQVLFHNKANGSLITKTGAPTDDDQQAVGSALLGQPFGDARYFHPRPSAAGNGYDPTASGGSNLGPLSAKLLNGTTKPAAPPATAPAGGSTAAVPATAPVIAAGPTTQPAVVVDFDGIKLRTLLYAQENNIEVVGSSQPLKGFQDDKGNYDQVKLIMAFNDSDHPLTFRTAKPIPADAVTASGSGLDPHISVENARIQAARVAAARGIPVEKVNSLVIRCTEGPDLGVFGDPGVNVLS